MTGYVVQVVLAQENFTVSHVFKNYDILRMKLFYIHERINPDHKTLFDILKIILNNYLRDILSITHISYNKKLLMSSNVKIYKIR